MSATPTAWIEGDIDVEGVRLHFHRTGSRDKPPLVLAHGLSDSGRCWARVAAALGDHFDIVMPDARNHGTSATATTSPDLLVSDVAELVSALGLERPALLGHSVGAHTMAAFAAQPSAEVSRLVLEDPPWTAAREHGADEAATQRRDQIRGWLASFAEMTDEEIAETGRTQHGDWHADEYPSWVESNRQVRVDAADGLALSEWGTTVADIACPTLLVHGEAERGGIVTSGVAEQVTRQNKNVTARLINNAGHNIRRENFERFIEVVSDFLLARNPASDQEDQSHQ